MRVFLPWIASVCLCLAFAPEFVARSEEVEPGRSTTAQALMMGSVIIVVGIVALIICHLNNRG
jgi:hypothetical protein